MEKENLGIMKKLVIAWDLDMTLINTLHRVKYKSNGEFDLKHWIESSKSWDIVSKDTLLPLYDLYLEFKKTGFTQICVTARNMKETDYRYLSENKLEFDLILHREDSMQLDFILKSEKLIEFFKKDNRIPFMAFDDKPENLQVFDNFGFRTFHAEYMNEKLRVQNFRDIIRKPGEFND